MGSDSIDFVTSYIDRSGKEQSYSYSTTKELSKSVNQEGGVNHYGLDPAGKLLGFTDPNVNTTEFLYDSYDRLTRRTYADGSSISYRYNNTGRVEKTVNGRGQSTFYYYDANGNLLTVNYNDPATPDLAYTYDRYGRLIQVEDGTGITGFSYDSASRISQIDGPLAQDTITYGYDSLNRVTSVQLENGITRTYSYDNQGRLTHIQAGAATYTYSFDSPASPLIKTLTRPHSSQTVYDYDGLNRLLEVNNLDSASNTLSTYTYRYNSDDLRDRETVTGSLTRPALADSTTTSSFNSVNQLLETIDPNQSFTYDGDGNMGTGYTPEGFAFTAEYDRADRLVSLSYTDDNSIEHKTEYTYRYDDFLAGEKRYQNTTLVSDVRYIRDGSLVIQERDGNTNSVVNEYVWGSNLGGGIGGLLQLTRNGADYSYLYDGRGNVVAVLDSSQTPVAQYRYDAFGKVVAQSGTLEQPFQFSTKRFDADTGLSYYGYRFYSSGVERWMNRDPLGEAGGINLYGFVGNDPVNFIDPLGLSGTLTIHSTNNHSWISYKPDGTTSGTTYGTWGNNPYGKGNGLHKNLEAGKTGAASRSGHLNDIQEKSLYDLIDKVTKEGADGWSHYHNCSDFASNAWNEGTGENLDPSNGWGPTPKGLKKDIWWKNGLRDHKNVKIKQNDGLDSLR